MAGSIVISSIQLDVDNNFSILSNTGTTLLSANASGLNVTSSFADNSISSDKIVSIANTKIDGLVTDNQIASVSNTKIDGLITNDQVASVANTKIDGLITSDQIANVAADKIVGTLGGNYVLTTFTSNGTWTKPADLKAIKVTVIGGGGGGGGAFQNFGEPQGGVAGAGGGGGIAIEYIPAPSLPGPVAVTVGSPGTAGPAPGTPGTVTAGGAGGTSSFGAFLSATGGSGATVAPDSTNGGSGGSGSGGNFNMEGHSGWPGSAPGQGLRSAAPNRKTYGGGGNPIFASGFGRTSLSLPGPSGTAGENGIANQGGGGGGARSTSLGSPTVNGTPVAGGAGSAGLIIVEEFY